MSYGVVPEQLYGNLHLYIYVLVSKCIQLVKQTSLLYKRKNGMNFVASLTLKRIAAKT